MDGSQLRALRQRLGLTQVELADAIGVDQSTVSRWERNVEAPRLARVAQINGLLRHEHLNRALTRQLATVRADLRPAVIVRDDRVTELSPKAIEHYRETRGVDASDHPGRSLAWHMEKIGNLAMLELFRQRVIDLEEIVLARLHLNIRGFGSVCEVEPLHAQEPPSGFIMSRDSMFEAEPTGEIRVERLDIVPLADPTRVARVYQRNPSEPRACAVPPGTGRWGVSFSGYGAAG